MFKYKNNKKRINKLESRVDDLKHTIGGGVFDYGLAGKVDDHKSAIAALEHAVSTFSKRITVLEEIVRESGLITDFDNDEVKIREDRTRDMFGGINVKNTPYQINKVKTL